MIIRQSKKGLENMEIADLIFELETLRGISHGRKTWNQKIANRGENDKCGGLGNYEGKTMPAAEAAKLYVDRTSLLVLAIDSLRKIKGEL